MPQNNVLPVWKAEYPLTAPAQKPGGVTVSTALWARAVPNKPQWTGTQMAEAESVEEHPQEELIEESHEEEVQEEEQEEDEDGHPPPRRGRRRR